MSQSVFPSEFSHDAAACWDRWVVKQSDKRQGEEATLDYWHPSLVSQYMFFPFSFRSVCPKWAKVQKQHTEKSSVVLLIVCSAALRVIELIKWVTTHISLFYHLSSFIVYTLWHFSAQYNAPLFLHLHQTVNHLQGRGQSAEAVCKAHQCNILYCRIDSSECLCIQMSCSVSE